MKNTTREAVKALIISKIRGVTREDLILLADTYGLEDDDFSIAEYFDQVARRVEYHLGFPEFPPTLLEREMDGDADKVNPPDTPTSSTAGRYGNPYFAAARKDAMLSSWKNNCLLT